jgi:hypothetical protein
LERHEARFWSGTFSIFQTVPGFTFHGATAVYSNPFTGTEFTIDAAEGDPELHQVDLQFELNVPYFRPSYMALEVAAILGDFVRHFDLKVDEPQMEGMSTSRYSNEGFLSGWNFRNQFAHRSFVRRPVEERPQYWVRPKAELDAVYAWNSRAGQQANESTLSGDRLHRVTWLND